MERNLQHFTDRKKNQQQKPKKKKTTQLAELTFQSNRNQSWRLDINSTLHLHWRSWGSVLMSVTALFATRRETQKPPATIIQPQRKAVFPNSMLQAISTTPSDTHAPPTHTPWELCLPSPALGPACSSCLLTHQLCIRP